VGKGQKRGVDRGERLERNNPRRAGPDRGAPGTTHSDINTAPGKTTDQEVIWEEGSPCKAARPAQGVHVKTSDESLVQFCPEISTKNDASPALKGSSGAMFKEGTVGN